MQTPYLETFADIGCGLGKPLLLAYCLHGFGSLAGVEILEGLVMAGRELEEMFMKQAKGRLERFEETENETTKETPITTTIGSFLDLNVFNWTSSEIVLCNGTLFPEELWAEVSRMASEMRPGSFFLSVNRELEVIEFMNVEMVLVEGETTPIFIMQRKSHEQVEIELEGTTSGDDGGENENENENENETEEEDV